VAEQTPKVVDRDREFRVSEAVTADLGELADLFRVNESDDEAVVAALSDPDTIFANEVSNEDLRTSVQKKLVEAHARNPQSEYAYDVEVQHVFPNEVIFKKQGKLMRQPYSVTDAEDGHVKLGGEPSEVRAVTRFVDHNPDQKKPGTVVAAEAKPEAPSIIVLTELDTKANEEVAANEAPENVLNKIKRLLGLTKPQANLHDSTIADTEQRSATKNEETTQMADTVKTETETLLRTERITKLVACEASPYNEKDADWMKELSDPAFTRIDQKADEVKAAKDAKDAADKKAKDAADKKAEMAKRAAEAVDETKTEDGTVTAASAKVVAKVESNDPRVTEAARPGERVVEPTAEEFIKNLNAPPALRRVFERAVESDKAARKSLITLIRANSKRLTEKFFEGLETDEIEAMAEPFQKKLPEANYAGSGMHTFERPASDAPKHAPMPSMSLTRDNGAAAKND